VFSFGHAYVALSRLRAVEGLYLAEPFDPTKIKADPKVLAFYGFKKAGTGPSRGGASTGLREEGENFEADDIIVPIASAETLALLQHYGQSLRGHVFIITRQLNQFSRAQCQQFIENNGGKIVVTLAKSLTDAVVGKKAGPSKLLHFKEHAIVQWTEDTLIAQVVPSARPVIIADEDSF
jgi:hypothetical protein